MILPRLALLVSALLVATSAACAQTPAEAPLPIVGGYQKAAVDDAGIFRSLDDVDETVRRLRTIRGVGEWTAHYIALRAAREPDAFPATDVALIRGAGIEAAALAHRAERWRPWRAYAAQHLWTKAAS